MLESIICKLQNLQYSRKNALTTSLPSAKFKIMSVPFYLLWLRGHLMLLEPPHCRGRNFKDFRNWNRFHEFDSNCRIKSSWHRFQRLEQGWTSVYIPCSTLALGWTWFWRLLDEKPMPRSKINILWSMGRPYSYPIPRSRFHPSICLKNLASDAAGGRIHHWVRWKSQFESYRAKILTDCRQPCDLNLKYVKIVD